MPLNIPVKWFKGVTVLKAVLFVRLLFGFYHNCAIIQNKTVAILIKLISFAYFLSFVYKAFDNRATGLQAVLITVSAIEAGMNVLTSLLREDQYFFRYLTVVRAIDVSMGFKETFHQNVITFSILVSVVFLRVTTLVIHLTFAPILRTIPQFYCYNYIYAVSNMSQLVNSFIYEMLWRRMRMLRQWVENQNEGDVSVGDRIRIWKTTLSTYKNLLANMRQTWTTIKIMSILAFPFELIRYLIISYQAVDVIMSEATFFVIMGNAIEAVCIFLSNLIPCFILELLIYEYEKIQNILADEIVRTSGSTDEELCAMLLLTKGYLDTRPPKYWLLRIIPTDLSYLVSILSYCTTYVIAMLQMK